MTSPPSRARTEEAKEERRVSILNAALHEFYERGLAGARLDDIADQAGVSKGTLYLYFDNKEALFRDLIHHYTGPTIKQLESKVSLAPSLEQALNSFVQISVDIIRQSEMPAVMKVMIGESQAFPDIIRHHRENIIEKTDMIFTKVLSAAKDRGEIEIDDPALVTRLMFAPIVYSSIWQSVFASNCPYDVDYETLLQTHVKLMLKGMNYRPLSKGISA